MDQNHNYLISDRKTYTLFLIDRTSNSITWRLGGPQSDFKLGEGVNFSSQHHARIISEDPTGQKMNISLMDNQGDRNPSRSSGKIIEIDTRDWTARLIQIFLPPDGIYARDQGSTQILANGNAFIGWGPAGAVSEYASDGELIFHAYIQSVRYGRELVVDSYRAFKCIWMGTPSEPPAVVALMHGESTMVYVSWNGDTETRVWRFYGRRGGEGEGELLEEAERSGFETGLYVGSGTGLWKSFRAVAIGKDGEKLVESEWVEKRPYIYPYVPGRDDLLVQNQGEQRILV